MVDVQPSFLEERFDQIDLVIDHHPVEHPIRAKIRDVRPSYGATSTILVEYLRAVDIKISQRLATSFLYSIKADTLGLERGGSRADLEAFTFLYMLANHNALRRIERPELVRHRATGSPTVWPGGRCPQRLLLAPRAHGHADQIPQFGLAQRKASEWSVVWVLDDMVHIPVRTSATSGARAR
jgi:hypothetical protein